MSSSLRGLSLSRPRWSSASRRHASRRGAVAARGCDTCGRSSPHYLRARQSSAAWTRCRPGLAEAGRQSGAARIRAAGGCDAGQRGPAAWQASSGGGLVAAAATDWWGWQIFFYVFPKYLSSVSHTANSTECATKNTRQSSLCRLLFVMCPLS